MHPHGQSPKSYSKNSFQSNPFFRTWAFTLPIFEVEPRVPRPQTHPCSMSNHPFLDPKHTLARYRTTRYSTSNTPLLDVEPPVTRPQTHPCSMSNYPFLDLKHTLVRYRTTRYSTSNIPLLDVEHRVPDPTLRPLQAQTSVTNGSPSVI